MTKLQICKSFIYLFFFYFKYTKSEQTNLVKMNYLQEREEKKKLLKLEQEWSHVLVFRDQTHVGRHAEDWTEADWLAGCRKKQVGFD